MSDRTAQSNAGTAPADTESVKGSTTIAECIIVPSSREWSDCVATASEIVRLGRERDMYYVLLLASDAIPDLLAHAGVTFRTELLSDQLRVGVLGELIAAQTPDRGFVELWLLSDLLDDTRPGAIPFEAHRLFDHGHGNSGFSSLRELAHRVLVASTGEDFGYDDSEWKQYLLREVIRSEDP